MRIQLPLLVSRASACTWCTDIHPDQIPVYIYTHTHNILFGNSSSYLQLYFCYRHNKAVHVYFKLNYVAPIVCSCEKSLFIKLFGCLKTTLLACHPLLSDFTPFCCSSSCSLEPLLFPLTARAVLVAQEHVGTSRLAIVQQFLSAPGLVLLSKEDQESQACCEVHSALWGTALRLGLAVSSILWFRVTFLNGIHFSPSSVPFIFFPHHLAAGQAALNIAHRLLASLLLAPGLSFDGGIDVLDSELCCLVKPV